MFLHNFKYAFKTLFKNRMLIFWTFAFPIILGTFFNMAFADIESSEKMDIIDIAVVNNEEFKENEVFKTVIEQLSDEKSDEQLFNTEYVDKKEAENLLNEEKISGYILLDDDGTHVTVATNGIKETIIKYTVDEIMQTTKIIEDSVESEVKNQMELGVLMPAYEKIYEDAVALSQSGEVNIRNVSRSNLSYTMIEFYTLIAMACLYGGIIGMTAMNQNLPNMTATGRRVGVSPTSKSKLVLSSVLAGYVTQVIGIAILFLYTIVALDVDYGDNLFLIVLLALVGCLAGLSMGIAIGTLIKSGENTKLGITIAVTMVGCFLSGMMGITMKYIVDKYLPIVNKINPAAMITDGFYSLYYYDTLDRYFFDVISLLIFSFIMIGVSFISLRRQAYDSI